MARHGFIKTKEEIKFLILYATGFLPFAVDLETIVDLCTWCDDGFGYFELKEAFDELINTGHMNKLSDELFEITEKGKETMELFKNHLPYTVREAAEQSALRVVQKLRRDAAVTTSVKKIENNDLLVSMNMQDVFSIQMHVVSQGQADILRKTFKNNAEKIYQVLLKAMTEDYK